MVSASQPPSRHSPDPSAVEFFDVEHSSKDESRFVLIGFAGAAILYVVFTEREADTIRIIHARRADRRMREIYENEASED